MIRMRPLALVALTCIATVCAAGAVEPSAKPAFTILQLNDVYKVEGLEGGAVGGIARVRTLRRQLEANGHPVLVLHAGDMLFPSVMSKFLRAQPMVRCLNLLDGKAGEFDPLFVATFGNHELDDPDPGLLLGRVAQSDFAWVSSNLRYVSAPGAPSEPLAIRLGNVHETMTVEVAGMKVGVLGLTADVQPRDYAAYGFDPDTRFATVRRAIDHLRANGAQMIVALTHQDMSDDLQLAQRFPEIDLVAGGHEHFFQLRKVAHAWVTKADADAKSVIAIDVRSEDGRAALDEPRRIALGANVEKDPTVEAEVTASLAALATEGKAATGHDLFTQVASTEHALEGVETAVRARETALGNFLADVVRDRMNTDVAFINGGAIRINDDIPAGTPIRRYDLEGIFYYDNNLVGFALSGAELIDILRNSVAKTHLGSGRFLQVSGVRFRYRVAGTAEAPTYRIEEEDVEVFSRDVADWRPLERTKRYSAATLDWVWENGYRDGYAIFARGKGGKSPTRTDGGVKVSWREATEQALAALPDHRVTTDIEGRITRSE